MFCKNCGTQLPEDANFCLKCGISQKESYQLDEPKWETCEIVGELKDRGFISFMIKGGLTGLFRAEAVGLKGRYVAGETPVVKFDTGQGAWTEQRGEETLQAINALVDKLVREGWEPVETRGQHWFSYRFHRRTN